MNCVVKLYNDNEEIEIVTDITDEIIEDLRSFIVEENISSEDLIKLLICNFIEPECLC